jgi:hypothetical protein
MPARRPAASAVPPSAVTAPAAAAPSLARRVLGWDWVVVLLASWLLPLLGFNLWPLSYLNSELFWALPVVALLPRFLAETHPGSRRRRAFGWAVLVILAAGSALDLGFGRYILTFGAGPYLGELAGVPYEEFLFYLLGPVAMLLVYFWADQHLLKALAPEERRRSDDGAGLLRFEPGLLAQALALFLAGVALKAVLGGEGPWLPWYFSFLLLSAYLPVLFFWRAVRGLVNWPALSLTVLYTLVTSLVWEQSLGVPLQWWGYQPRAMLGLWVKAWQHGPLPIEALSVWVVAPFACVFFFEVVRRLHYHPGQGLGPKLKGSVPTPPANRIPAQASPTRRSRSKRGAGVPKP